MLRAVLDTNILVSALLNPQGAPADILRKMAIDDITVFYSPVIFAEYQEVLFRAKFGFDQVDVENLLGQIRLQGIMELPDVSTVSMPDESDRVFYDTAKFCNAYLITGNKKHYPREKFIVSPAEFLYA